MSFLCENDYRIFLSLRESLQLLSLNPVLTGVVDHHAPSGHYLSEKLEVCRKQLDTVLPILNKVINAAAQSSDGVTSRAANQKENHLRIELPDIARKIVDAGLHKPTLRAEDASVSPTTFTSSSDFSRSAPTSPEMMNPFPDWRFSQENTTPFTSPRDSSRSKVLRSPRFRQSSVVQRLSNCSSMPRQRQMTSQDDEMYCAPHVMSPRLHDRQSQLCSPQMNAERLSFSDALRRKVSETGGISPPKRNPPFSSEDQLQANSCVS